MKTFSRLRKRPLAAGLAAALAFGAPLAIAGAASGGFGTAPRLGDGHALASVAARLAPHTASPNGVPTGVTNCNDSGAGSLRDAVANAADGESIDLRALTCSTITLDSAISVGALSLNIYGPGRDRLTIDGGGATRLFEATGGQLSLVGLRLANGYASGDGGCILSQGVVQLNDSLITGCYALTVPIQARGGAISATGVVLYRSEVTSNAVESVSSYAKGGGVYAHGALVELSTIDSNEARSTGSRGFGGVAFITEASYFFADAITRNKATNAGGLSFIGGPAYAVMIADSTISGNVAGAFMGGIYTYTPIVLENSTLAFNCAEQTEVRPGYISAVGIEVYQATLDLESTILSNNDLCVHSNAPATPAGSTYDLGLYGVGPVSGANNLVVTSTTTLPPGTIRTDPMLAPLADNGGLSLTHALLPGSPAIGAGNNLVDLPFDQRWSWFARVNGTNPDIGAYETQTPGTTRTVDTCGDDGAGSLRSVIASSVSGDTIDLSALGCSRITLTSGAIPIAAGNLRIIGPGSANLAIDGNGASRIFEHNGDGRLDLSGLTFENGYYAGASTNGGGCILSGSFVRGTDTTFSSCEAHIAGSTCYGGAVLAGGAAFYGSRLADNLCASDSQTGGGAVAVEEDLTLANSTLAGNALASAPGDQAIGGGFFALREAAIAFSTISGNAAQIAAGGYSSSVFVAESTISGNAAELEIGGIAATMATLYNSTVAFNTSTSPAYDFAAGLSVFAHADLSSSILFGNTRSGDAFDVGTQVGTLSGSDNLIGASPSPLPPGTINADPLLGPLADNGGPTATHALSAGSPALDAGNNDAGFDTDQRGPGFTRVFNGRADIGAIEMQDGSGDAIFVNGFDPPI